MDPLLPSPSFNTIPASVSSPELLLMPPEERKFSRLAIISFVLSLIYWPLFLSFFAIAVPDERGVFIKSVVVFITLVLLILGFVDGIRALREIGKTPALRGSLLAWYGIFQNTFMLTIYLSFLILWNS